MKRKMVKNKLNENLFELGSIFLFFLYMNIYFYKTSCIIEKYHRENFNKAFNKRYSF